MAGMILYRVRTWRKGKLSRTEFLHRKDAVAARLHTADLLARVDHDRPRHQPFDHYVLVDLVDVNDVPWEAYDG